MMPKRENISAIHREVERYTREQMRLLLCIRDMVKDEVKKEVARQLQNLKK